MYRKILPALLLMGSATAFAQAPSLTGYNINPAFNDSFVSIVCDTNGISEGAAGASIPWDFSLILHPTTSVYPIDTGYVSYATTAPGYSLLSVFSAVFAASNVAIMTPQSTLTNFYKAGADKLTLTGLYQSSSVNAVYTDGLDVLQYPFTYLTTFTDTYAGAITFGGSPAVESGSVTVTGDAWGNLQLPPVPPATSATMYANVLRVHSFQSFRDSAGLFGTTPQTDTIETYTWYQAGYHSALLTISTTKGPFIHNKVVSYAQRSIANHEAVPNVAGLDNSLKLYPNPASGYIYILYNNADGQKVRTTLVDMLGREVAVISDLAAQGATNLTYNTSSLSKGLYLVRLQSTTETVTRKIEIQ